MRRSTCFLSLEPKRKTKATCVSLFFLPDSRNVLWCFRTWCNACMELWPSVEWKQKDTAPKWKPVFNACKKIKKKENSEEMCSFSLSLTWSVETAEEEQDAFISSSSAGQFAHSGKSRHVNPEPPPCPQDISDPNRIQTWRELLSKILNFSCCLNILVCV